MPADTRRLTTRARPGRRLALLAALCTVSVALFVFAFVRGSFDFALPRRATMVAAMIVVAYTQAVATVIFHTVTNNRILSPAILGFDSMYTLMQTLTVFFFGGTVLTEAEGLPKLIAQTGLMVVAATLLYRWLFTRKAGSLFTLLMVGIVLGLAFDSVSTFLQRMLSPLAFDLLSLQLFGRISDVNAEHLPLAFAVCIATGILVWRRRHTLDVLLLGRDQATSLGINYTRELTLWLVVIALLVAFSTVLAGPMTFFGFLVATLAYQITGDQRHQWVLPMATLLGVFALVGGHFVMQHIFYAAGHLTVVIEFVGGIVFIALLLRRKGAV